MHKFETTGSVEDGKKSGRPSVVKDNVVVAEVLHKTNVMGNNTEYGECSIQRIAQQLDLSNTRVWCILRKQLRMYNYKNKILLENKDNGKSIKDPL